MLPPFSALVDAHKDALWRHLVATTGADDAPDLLQDTLLTALRAYPSLRSGENLRGWLFAVAHSRVVDAARARERRPVPVGAVPDAPARPAPDTDDDDLWAAVRRLPDKQRGAVALRYVADLPYADIGTALGCSEAAARQNVRAALARLREELS